jgi:hypothetical protein
MKVYELIDLLRRCRQHAIVVVRDTEFDERKDVKGVNHDDNDVVEIEFTPELEG